MCFEILTEARYLLETQEFTLLRNACIRSNLAYSESWNIQNPSVIASRRVFRTL